MPITNGNTLLAYAKKERFAVGAFNAENMEMIQAILDAAQEEHSPVIIQITPFTINYAGLSMAASMVKTAASQVDVPVVIHLDHGTSLEQNVQCIREGFSSLMFDGSSLPYEQNVRETARIAEIAHCVGIPLEAELGKVLQNGASVEDVRRSMTDPELARDFAARTNCDSLAVAVGSVHAMKTSEAELDIELIQRIYTITGLPLVLHGGSGIKSESIQDAIKVGICKVNIGTYLKQGFSQELRNQIERMPGEVDFRKFINPAKQVIKQRVIEKMRIFGSSGRAANHNSLGMD